MLGWFNTKELDAFADSLLAEILERVPPSKERLSGTKAFQRVVKTFGKTFERIDTFARSRRLNVYKKARFANRIRWAMSEAGYPEDFVDTMTRELLVHLTPPRETGK